ncbi:MAG: IniB N-terminal domain-containing protein, partial [Aeromicrobium sp.]
MSTSTTLLNFILGLLGNESKAAAFEANPDATLAGAGLSGVSVADVDAMLPLIADYVPVSAGAASAGAVTAGAVTAGAVSSGAGDFARSASAAGPASSGPSGHDGGGGDSTEIVTHLQFLINHYSFNGDNMSVISQNIWADGDVEQAFAQSGGIALGEDAELEAEGAVVTGAGAIGLGEDSEFEAEGAVVTGAGAVGLGEDSEIEGPVVTGAGAVALGEDSEIEGPVTTGNGNAVGEDSMVAGGDIIYAEEDGTINIAGGDQ